MSLAPTYIAIGGIGHKNHLAVSDGRENRITLCGIRFPRNGTAWTRYQWVLLSPKDHPPVTCRLCIINLTGKEELE